MQLNFPSITFQKAEDSIPELEVMEHDVVGWTWNCNGPIDEQQLFYLEARGLDKQEAKRTFIAAFLNSTLSEMGVSAYTNGWFRAHKKLESLESKLENDLGLVNIGEHGYRPL